MISAARYLRRRLGTSDVPWGRKPPRSPASISKQTEGGRGRRPESSVVRMFDDGELVSEIIPEIWLLSGYGSFPTARSGAGSRTT